MYNYKKKLKGFAIVKMKKMRAEGITVEKIAKEFGVSKSIVLYHTSEIYKIKQKARLTKYKKDHRNEVNETNRSWRRRQSASFHKSVCLSTIRMRLRDGSVTKVDLFNVMSEFD